MAYTTKEDYKQRWEHCVERALELEAQRDAAQRNYAQLIEAHDRQRDRYENRLDASIQACDRVHMQLHTVLGGVSLLAERPVPCPACGAEFLSGQQVDEEAS